MTIDPHLAADEQQRQQQSGDIGAVVDVAASGIEIAGAVVRGAARSVPEAIGTDAGLGGPLSLTSNVAEAASGAADAAEAGGGFFSALGDLFGGLSF
jgi:hypothetical protein